GPTKIPLLGVENGEVISIPCFAAARVDPTNPQGLNAQTDPVNVGPVGQSIPPDGTGAEVQVYFGCWLAINQTNFFLPDRGSTGAAYPPEARRAFTCRAPAPIPFWKWRINCIRSTAYLAPMRRL